MNVYIMVYKPCTIKGLIFFSFIRRQRGVVRDIGLPIVKHVEGLIRVDEDRAMRIGI